MASLPPLPCQEAGGGKLLQFIKPQEVRRRRRESWLQGYLLTVLGEVLSDRERPGILNWVLYWRYSSLSRWEQIFSSFPSQLTLYLAVWMMDIYLKPFSANTRLRYMVWSSTPLGIYLYFKNSLQSVFEKLKHTRIYVRLCSGLANSGLF